MNRRFTLFAFLFVAFLVSLTPSCKNFEGSQTVPAYIYIDTVEVSCDYFVYGANTHKIIDAKILIDDNDLGVFELPAMVPVLKEGIHKVAVYPGIARDGIRYYRTIYYFLKPWENFNVNFEKGVVDTLRPVFTYYPIGGVDLDMHKAWLEDFDRGTNSFRKAAGSDTSLLVVNGGPYTPNDPGGTYATQCGKLVLTSDTMQFRVYNDGELNKEGEFEKVFDLGGAVMMELDYMCSDTMLVSLYYYQDYQPNTEPIICLYPTGASGEEPEQWNKIYINIGPYMYDYKDADYFKILFSSWPYRREGTQYFYLDNVKLFYRDKI